MPLNRTPQQEKDYTEETEQAPVPTPVTKEEIEKIISDGKKLQEHLPEAAVSFTLSLHGAETGADILATIRGTDYVSALDSVIGLVKYAKGFGLHPSSRQGKGIAHENTRQEKGNEQEQNLGKDENGNQIVSSGTSPINEIEIDAKGIIKFSVGKFQFPFSDKRGAGVVIQKFDPATGFVEADLAKPVVYTPKEFGDLFADWQCILKNEKRYYNIVRIHG